MGLQRVGHNWATFTTNQKHKKGKVGSLINVLVWTRVSFSSVQLLSCLTLQPRELQHARAPCPSPTPRVHSNSCPLGEGNGAPLQYSCPENPMDGGAWWAAVHGVPKSRTWLSSFTFNFHLYALEKEMATHSSVLDWRILGTGEPGGLPSMGSHRVGHDWSDLAAAAACPLR